ncbi:MAG: glycerophosphodiester phosphodiesterase [Opitutae bacterium]|nr:glycerophosphodiester phosphodiesterase [Opitutae bacterium]
MISLQRSLSLFALTCLLAAPAARATDLVAHRGASFEAPENTLAAANLAWQNNADVVELDIHLTKDGKLVVTHDANLKRVTGRDAAIVDLTFDEIRQLDAGSWKNPKYAGEKIPSLDELIATLPAGKRLFVEIKTGPESVPELAATLARTKMTEKQISLISFNYETLVAARKALPAYTTIYVSSYKKPKDPSKAPPSLDKLIEDCRKAGLHGLDLQHTWPLDAAAVKKIRDAGLQLHVWTIDTPEIARRWIALGADSITTNRASWLREQLSQPAAVANK